LEGETVAGNRPFMLVHATNTLSNSSPAPRRRAASGSAFSVADADAMRSAAQSAAPRAVASLDVLVALQSFDDPIERRRKAVRHGRTALDALDSLKVGLISGTLDRDALVRLKTLAESLGESSGDGRLDAVLAEIRLRAAVELAKYARP